MHWGWFLKMNLLRSLIDVVKYKQQITFSFLFQSGWSRHSLQLILWLIGTDPNNIQYGREFGNISFVPSMTTQKTRVLHKCLWSTFTLHSRTYKTQCSWMCRTWQTQAGLWRAALGNVTPTAWETCAEKFRTLNKTCIGQINQLV